jgi:hypothetical protein
MSTPRLSVFALALAVPALLVSGCGSEVAAQAEVGECFQTPDATDGVGELEKVDCSEPHDNEVFAVFDLPDGDFPGSETTQDQALEGCLERFEDYVGESYDESPYGIQPIAPSEESWNDADDREVICALYLVDGSQMEGSVADA